MITEWEQYGRVGVKRGDIKTTGVPNIAGKEGFKLNGKVMEVRRARMPFQNIGPGDKEKGEYERKSCKRQ